MDEALKRKLKVVAGMLKQHVGSRDIVDRNRGIVDGRGVNANETAFRLLADHGFMELLPDTGEPLRARWTETGRTMFENNRHGYA